MRVGKYPKILFERSDFSADGIINWIIDCGIGKQGEDLAEDIISIYNKSKEQRKESGEDTV
jgi:hypothetical protein